MNMINLQFRSVFRAGIFTMIHIHINAPLSEAEKWIGHGQDGLGFK